MTSTTELASLPALEDGPRLHRDTRTEATARADNAHLSTVNGYRSLAANTRHRAALLALGRALAAAGYHWVSPTADTQALVNIRFPNRQAHDLCGVFGWNRPFSPELLSQPMPTALLDALCEADVLQSAADGATLRSRVSFSSLAGTLVAHSAWSTCEADPVFLGPDAYRFGAFIERELRQPAALQRRSGDHVHPCTVVDLGCGSGASGILAAHLLMTDGAAGPVRVLFTDTNARALRFATVNAELAGVQHFECRHSEAMAAVPERIDVVLAHPLYPLDERTDSHGSGDLGTGWVLRIVQQALQQLAPGGLLLLYTAAPVVKGVDVLWRVLRPVLAQAAVERKATHRYELIDPDVSGAALARPAYAQVDRLSLMGLSVRMPL